jgi:hypothetical protein
MALLRYLLILASAGTAVFLIYVALTERVNSPGFMYSWIVFCVLNFLYLVCTPIADNRWRALRLISLWFDAKEAELRARGKRET